MAASVYTAPPAKSLHLDHLWLTLQSDLVATQPSFFRVGSTAANSPGEQVTFTFGGTSVTFTVAASPDTSGLQIPQRIAQTDEEYAEELAAAIGQNEIITNTFYVYHFFSTSGGGAWFCWLTAKDLTALALSVVEDIANCTVTTFSSTGPYGEDNLRALIEIYNDTGAMVTDRSLGQQHAPYGADQLALFDLRSHFADLEPTPPSTASLAAFAVAHEASMYRAWYFRYADKYGTPAVAEAMQKVSGGLVLFGGHSADAVNDYADTIQQHITTLQDGSLFWKPAAVDQPDWAYHVPDATASTYTYNYKIYWADGTTTESGFSTPFSMTANQVYSLAIGPAQLGIEATAVAEGKDPWRLEVSLHNATRTIFTRRFELYPNCTGWGLHVLYTNGIGGMETVWLRGPKITGQRTGAQYARRPRTDSWTLADADTQAFDPQAVRRWDASTGYYDHPDYLRHLQQLPLATKAWIVDSINSRYLPVHIEPGEIQTEGDDQDLYFLPVEITAAWIDQQSNY